MLYSLTKASAFLAIIAIAHASGDEAEKRHDSRGESDDSRFSNDPGADGGLRKNEKGEWELASKDDATLDGGRAGIQDAPYSRERFVSEVVIGDITGKRRIEEMGLEVVADEADIVGHRTALDARKANHEKMISGLAAMGGSDHDSSENGADSIHSDATTNGSTWSGPGSSDNASGRTSGSSNPDSDASSLRDEANAIAIAEEDERLRYNETMIDAYLKMLKDPDSEGERKWLIRELKGLGVSDGRIQAAQLRQRR